MPTVLKRFITDQLDATTDLRLCKISEPLPNTLQIRTNLQVIRIIFAMLFAIPCLSLLINAVISPTIVSILFALFFCPALLVLAVLAGLTEYEKKFDLSARIATKSLRLFRFYTRESLPLPTHGIVSLSWSLTTGGRTNPGSSHKYTISVQQCPGFIFAIHKDYNSARKFAERLSNFLTFSLDDSVPSTYRM